MTTSRSPAGKTRREFLLAAGAAVGGLAAARGLGSEWARGLFRREIPVRDVSNGARGHLLRDGRFPEPTETRDVGVAIVGGGIAGLSAAWELERRGVRDLALFELDDAVGGNSRSGENAVSAYPWGAHYLPLPGPEARFVRELLEEFGVIEGYDAAGVPRFHDLYLCAAPHERLFLHGAWQDGVLPEAGVTAGERAEAQAFFAEMDRFKRARGRDGRRAFAIPLELSSRDSELTALDRLTMADYLRSQGWRSPYLHWYVDYCCRDDFGTPAEQTSAWAGVHYFAARTGAASGVSGHPVLTWPEGNGWLVGRLRAKLARFLEADSLVFRVGLERGARFVDVFRVREGRTVRVRARSVVVATPRFVAARLVDELRAAPPSYLAAFTYAPWLVANVTVDRWPLAGDVAPAWDNVIFSGRSLGYVVATHQAPRLAPGPTVLTFYQPLDELAPTEARRAAVARTSGEWRALIVGELARAHPGIDERIVSIETRLWGHAMARPVPGFITGEARRAAARSLERLHFAHSDLSGLSLFEEAQYWGVTAARRAARDLEPARARGGA